MASRSGCYSCCLWLYMLVYVLLVSIGFVICFCVVDFSLVDIDLGGMITHFFCCNLVSHRAQWQNWGVARGSLGHPILKNNNFFISWNLVELIWQNCKWYFNKLIFLSSTLNIASFANFNHSCSLYIVRLRNKMRPEFLAGYHLCLYWKEN